MRGRELDDRAVLAILAAAFVLAVSVAAAIWPCAPYCRWFGYWALYAWSGLTGALAAAAVLKWLHAEPPERKRMVLLAVLLAGVALALWALSVLARRGSYC